MPALLVQEGDPTNVHQESLSTEERSSLPRQALGHCAARHPCPLTREAFSSPNVVLASTECLPMSAVRTPLMPNRHMPVLARPPQGGVCAVAHRAGKSPPVRDPSDSGHDHEASRASRLGLAWAHGSSAVLMGELPISEPHGSWAVPRMWVLSTSAHADVPRGWRNQVLSLCLLGT